MADQNQRSKSAPTEPTPSVTTTASRTRPARGVRVQTGVRAGGITLTGAD